MKKPTLNRSRKSLFAAFAALATMNLGATPVAASTIKYVVNPQTSRDWSSFDFKNGTAYPAQVTVNLEDGTVTKDSTTAWAVVSLSDRTPNTVIAHVRCYNGTNVNVSNTKTRSVIFRPGDPLRRKFSCPVSYLGNGGQIKLYQASVPDGAKRGRASAVINVGSENTTLPSTKLFRKAIPFHGLGTLVYDAKGSDIKYSDSDPGGSVWSTRLSHGRTQDGNGETGYYGRTSTGVFETSGTDLKIKTRRLDPAEYASNGGEKYPFLAGVLSAHKSKDLQFTYGSIEWEAVLPNRKYSWPAFWLLPADGGWPPEIDVFEGFGYNNSWDLNSSLSTNIHGGAKLQRTFTRAAARHSMSDFGLPSTLASDYHKFQVSISANWITMYVDDVQTMRYVNPFAGRTWYPIMNVAVLAPTTASYSAGSGTMHIRNVRIWRMQ